MADEWPFIMDDPPGVEMGYKGPIEPGMTVCVEVLMGQSGYGECIKLEQQVCMTENGIVQMSSYPFEEDFL